MPPRISSIMSRLCPASRILRYSERDVWGEFTPMAIAHNSVNLGQGFPNFPAPDFIKDCACQAIKEDKNQYAPSKGLLKLREALAKFYHPIYDRNLDPDKEILVTQGANQGISACMQAFIEPGDEVILIEPFFDIYRPSVELPGGKIVTIPLRLKSTWKGVISSDEWYIDMDELEGKITKKTKGILLNTPHNPTGKLFTRAELTKISQLATKHNLMIFSDEVMEKIATIPGMWERTITFGSAGKAFGVTGWRIGWIVGPSTLLKPILAVHSRTVFTTVTPLQEAVARGLEIATQSNFFEENRKKYQGLRDKAVSIFSDLGFPVAIPHGSYFFLIDISNASFPFDAKSTNDPNIIQTRDYEFCRWLTKEIGVTPIPSSVFYSDENRSLGENMVRICFCKDEATLDEAKRRLAPLQKPPNI